jgi:hypothetical protein
MKRGTVFTLFIIFGWVSGHFTYQWLFGSQDWQVAIGRSYFTTIAQLMLWWALRSELKDET